MKSIRLFSLIFFACSIGFPQCLLAQEPRSTPATFPKQHGALGPSAVSSAPIEITLDFSDTKGEFSPYLFMVADSPDAVAQGYQSAKEAQFKVIAMGEFLNDALSFGLAEDKARFLVQHNLEGVIFFPASEFMPAHVIEQQVDALISTINELKKKYPSLQIKTFLFGNEPDLAGNIFWNGTQEQFFQSYAVFARHLKSKDSKCIVGGANFSSFSGGWPKDFLRFISQEKIPLDVVSFHAYSSEVKKGFLEGIEYIKKLLIEFPIFDTPKIAITEWDIKVPVIREGLYRDQMDTAWRAAHNILALSAMAENGLWMSAESSGPFRSVTAFSPSQEEYYADSLWVKKDGTLKPVYYAHKAFNALADTVALSQKGSDFQTFGVSAGRSKDSQSLVIVISHYDPNAYLATYGGSYELLPGASPIFDSIPDLKRYTRYKIQIKNLPWTQEDALVLERYVIDDQRRFELEEISEFRGNGKILIARDITMPSVQLIKLYRK